MIFHVLLVFFLKTVTLDISSIILPFDSVQVNEMNVSTQFNYILALINCIGNLFKLGGKFLFTWDNGKLISVSPLFVYHIL